MADDHATSYQEKYSGLVKKKQLEFHKIIEVYHQSGAFLDLMDKYDDEMHPVNMSLGWDKFVDAVHKFYPDTVNPADFPSLWAVPVIENDDQSSGSGLRAVPQHYGSSSSRRSFDSRGKVSVRASPASKGPLYGKIRQPTPGKRIQTEETSSESSEELDEDEEAASSEE